MTSKKLDQYYTKKHIAIECFQKTISIINRENIIFDLWLEPSAGSSSFFESLPSNKIGFDLEPKCKDVIQQNFLNVDMLKFILEDTNFVSIGNPPFGKNSSLAIKFFNKCAENSILIAFILPRTFKKISVIEKLNPYFHLIYEDLLPENSFEFNNKSYNVPCVFQIWRKKNKKRPKVEILKSHSDFIFVEKLHANFAIQRVGVNAGAIKTDFNDCSASSHYFIKSDNNAETIFKKIIWDDVKFNTAGNPSISKHELILLYEQFKMASSRRVFS